MRIAIQPIPTPLGDLLAGASDAGVCLLEFPERWSIETQGERLSQLFGLPLAHASHPHLETLRLELEQYFAGELKHFSVPVLLRGTAFQVQVWQALQAIPYGETISYSTLAQRVGRPKAVRAVGSANGANRISIVIPCHRVIGQDGQLTGYGGGLWRKQRLLELETRGRL